MAQFVKLVPENLKALREVNPRLMSYNVEFAEVLFTVFQAIEERVMPRRQTDAAE